MTTLNATTNLNGISNSVVTEEPQESWWSQFMGRLTLVLSGAWGMTPEQLEEMDTEGLKICLGDPWMMY